MPKSRSGLKSAKELYPPVPPPCQKLPSLSMRNQLRAMSIPSEPSAWTARVIRIASGRELAGVTFRLCDSSVLTTVLELIRLTCFGLLDENGGEGKKSRRQSKTQMEEFRIDVRADAEQSETVYGLV